MVREVGRKMADWWDTLGDIWGKITSPGALALGGTGLGLYGAWDQARQQAAIQRQQDAYRRQQQASIDAYNKMMADYIAAQRGDLQRYYDTMTGGQADWMSLVRDAANQPVSGFMQDITDAERAAILRTPKANMAERGIQPGGYWDSISAEVLAKDAESRYATALGAKNNYVNELLGTRPQFPAPIFGTQPPAPQYPNPPYVPQPINYGAVGSPLAGYGQYQQLLAALSRMKSPEQKPPEISNIPQTSDQPLNPFFNAPDWGT